MKLHHVLLLACLFFAGPAFALSLEEAKAQGLVGEDASGYLAAVPATPSAEVMGLVTEINAKRREEYQRIAEKNEVPLDAVEKLAGGKAIERTEAGHYIRPPDSTWRVK